MATIYNTELLKELISAGKIQTSRDNVPNQIAEKVVPVMEVNPKLLRRANIVRSIQGSTWTTSTIYTTPTNQDFYLTSCTIAFIKDAAQDSATGDCHIQATIDGATRYILALPTLTLTAQNMVATITFATPIKIDRNTAISWSPTAAAAAGTSSRLGTITGYVDESSLA